MKEQGQKVICLDLHKTLLTENVQPPSLKYGAEDLLRELTDAGFILYITTLGSTEYAQEEIRKVGVDNYFKRIFGREFVGVNQNLKTHLNGKFYRPVAEEMGFSDEEAQANMITVGDAPGDRPADINGMVFIHLGLGNRHDPLIIREIITALLENGDGHFMNGFNRLFSQGLPVNISYPETHEARIYRMGNGVRFLMDRWESETDDYAIPIITSIES